MSTCDNCQKKARMYGELRQAVMNLLDNAEQHGVEHFIVEDGQIEWLRDAITRLQESALDELTKQAQELDMGH